MGKHALIAASLLILALTRTADAQMMQGGSFPCQAFQMQSNGMLAVMEPVTIQGPNGSIKMGRGMSFGPGVSMMGINVYETYRQNCR